MWGNAGLKGKLLAILTAGLLAGPMAAQAATVFTDLASFVTATGPNSVATFDDVVADTHAPFISGGVVFSGGTGGEGGVIDIAVTLPHSYWFKDQGTPPNWAWTVNGLNEATTITFPSNVVAFGFLLRSFAGDSLPDDAGMQWTLLSESNETVDSGTTVYDFHGAYESYPYFLGVQSTTPFKSMTIMRTNISTGTSSGGVWFLEDVRFDPVPTPDPALIDIVPGKDSNIINLRSKGLVPVAVLTGDTFDALQVDPSTTRFGPNEAAAIQYRVKDVDGDGDVDLLLKFRVQQTGIVCSDTEATLNGKLYDGTQFTGSDSIQAKNCQ